MAGVEGEDEFRDADDGAETAPLPSSSRASSPSNAKPAAAAGGFGRRLLASIRLPSSFSATIGRSASPSGPKPLEPQPPVAPNLGLGLLLHQGPNPSADGSPTFDASAGNVHLHTMVDLQKRLEEGLGEQGTKADGEDQVIGHDVGVGDKLLVLVPMEEESQEKEDVADGCSGNRNVYSTKELDKEGEQHMSVELGAAMEDQEVMEQEGATKCYTAVEDQSKNNDADKCTGDSPTAIKDDSAVEEKVATEQGCSVGTLVVAEDAVAGELQEEDGLLVEGQCEDGISVHEQNKVVEECMGDELRVAMGNCWVHNQEEAVVKNEYFDAAVEDQSDNLALEQHYSDEFNDDNVVEYKDKTVEQEGAIGIEGAAKDGIVVRLQKEDVLVEDQGEVQKVDVVEQCTSDVLEVAMGDGTVQDQELSVEQEGITEYFYAVVEDCSNKAFIMQCTSDELSAVKNGNIVEKEEALDQEGEFGILGAAENIVTEGLQAKSNMVVEGEGEDIISIHYQQIVLETCTSDEPGVSLGDSMVQDHEVTVLDQEGITECFAATVEDQSNISAFDELNTVKDGYFVEEKEKVMVEECAIDILGSAKNDDTVGSQEKGEVEVEVVSEQGEDVVSLQDQSRITTDVSAAHDQEVVEQDVAIFVRVGTVDAIAIDAQEKPVEQYGGDESRATKGTADEEKVVDQGDLADKQYAMNGNSAVESQENEGLAVKMEGEDRISIRDQDKVVEQCTSDQCGKTMDDNAADQEVRREKIRFCVGYPQRPGRPNCRAYMSTGSCSYGLSCYLNHPPQLKAMPEVPSFSSEQRNHETAQILQLNRVGLPIRENARNCTYYMRNATCRYGKRCCFNHPEHVLDVQIYKLTGWDDTNLPSSPHSKISSSPQLKKSSEDDCISSSSGILPPNLLQMLLPPQIVSPDSETKETKAKKDPDWSSASDDSDGCCSANFSGGPLRKQELHLDYTERRDRQECTFLLKYGNCKFASSCQYYHPTDDSARKYHQKGPSLAKLMVYPDRPGEPECPFYMKTGACKFRAECKFHHPKDLTPSIQGPVIPKRLVDAKELHLETKTTLQDHMNQQQNYPERPDQPECRYYMQFGKCKFLSACKFHHPKNRVACMPECPFYMKTGTCQFGSECEFYHPKHRGSSKEGEIDDGTDYVHDCPERPGENECSNYMKHGYCRSQMNC